MAGLTIKNLRSPDETRPFQEDEGQVELFHLGGTTIGKVTMQPGWRWSTHVSPMAGTRTCEVSHVGYCVSGRMRVVMDDGERAEIGPGDAFVIRPGHDAWVLGDEPFVGFDFGGGMPGYARRGRGREEVTPPPIH
ncbi:MAG TPA: cupin domain-containing protein [Vulgatibacter sp.]|nr:cupin domain-containing protein [Vulgatibacter sp.]